MCPGTAKMVTGKKPNTDHAMVDALAQLTTGLQLLLQEPSAEPLDNQHWLELRALVYKLCTAPGAPPSQLYERLQTLLTAHVGDIAARLERVGDSEELLGQYDAEWRRYLETLGGLRRLLQHFDATYTRTHGRRGVAPRPGVHDTSVLGLLVWRQGLFLPLQPRPAPPPPPSHPWAHPSCFATPPKLALGYRAQHRLSQAPRRAARLLPAATRGPARAQAAAAHAAPRPAHARWLSPVAAVGPVGARAPRASVDPREAECGSPGDAEDANFSLIPWSDRRALRSRGGAAAAAAVPDGAGRRVWV